MVSLPTTRKRTLAKTESLTGDRERRLSKVGGALAAIGVVGLAALWLVAAMRTPQEGILNADVIEHAESLGYVASIKAEVRWPLRPASAHDAIPGSALTIQENGGQLGRYEIDPREIRNKGGGRYAFYGDRLAFSTPDATDPRTNGRTYTWKLPHEAHPGIGLYSRILGAGTLLTFRYLYYPHCLIAESQKFV